MGHSQLKKLSVNPSSPFDCWDTAKSMTSFTSLCYNPSDMRRPRAAPLRKATWYLKTPHWPRTLIFPPNVQQRRSCTVDNGEERCGTWFNGKAIQMWRIEHESRTNIYEHLLGFCSIFTKRIRRCWYMRGLYRRELQNATVLFSCEVIKVQILKEGSAQQWEIFFQVEIYIVLVFCSTWTVFSLISQLLYTDFHLAGKLWGMYIEKGLQAPHSDICVCTSQYSLVCRRMPWEGRCCYVLLISHALWRCQKRITLLNTSS